MDIIEQLKQQYIQAAIAHGENKETGNFKEVNKQYKKLKIIYDKIKENIQEYSVIIDSLLDYNNNYVKAWAATHSLTLGISIKLAEKVLQEIQKQEKNLLGFGASMVLKQWKAGKLKC